jgi:hypothetical protein
MDTYLKPLEGPKLKIERAKEHIHQLDAELLSFR